MSDEKSKEKAQPAEEKPKVERKPTAYTVLTPVDGQEGVFATVGQVTALTAKKAKAQIAAQLSTEAPERLTNGGVALAAVPANSLKTEVARVEQRAPRVVIN
jgi:hypothetical protein